MKFSFISHGDPVLIPFSSCHPYEHTPFSASRGTTCQAVLVDNVKTKSMKIIKRANAIVEIRLSLFYLLLKPN